MTTVTESIRKAAEVLRQGGLVAFPTETVYGLGANAFDAAAVKKIFVAKGRPSDNPTIVHLADTSQLGQVAKRVPKAAALLLESFAPGPITVVVPKRADLPDVVTAGLDTVAIRIPSHPVAHALLESFGGPVAAPSANRSGRPSPTDWQAAVAELDGRVDVILRGRPSVVGLESTVVYCAEDEPVVLRPGGISAKAIAKVLGVPVERLYQHQQADPDEQREIHSPGTRHRHYAPAARVLIVQQTDAERIDDTISLAEQNPQQCGFIGLNQPGTSVRFRLAMHCASRDAYGQELYAFFRACENANVQNILCEAVDGDGIGAAIMDRLQRAAAATSAE